MPLSSPKSWLKTQASAKRVTPFAESHLSCRQSLSAEEDGFPLLPSVQCFLSAKPGVAPNAQADQVGNRLKSTNRKSIEFSADSCEAHQSPRECRPRIESAGESVGEDDAAGPPMAPPIRQDGTPDKPDKTLQSLTAANQR